MLITMQMLFLNNFRKLAEKLYFLKMTLLRILDFMFVLTKFFKGKNMLGQSHTFVKMQFVAIFSSTISHALIWFKSKTAVAAK